MCSDPDNVVEYKTPLTPQRRGGVHFWTAISVVLLITLFADFQFSAVRRLSRLAGPEIIVALGIALGVFLTGVLGVRHGGRYGVLNLVVALVSLIMGLLFSVVLVVLARYGLGLHGK